MTRYFADTFFYLAVLNDRDQAHERALEVNDRLTGGVVTTQYVLTEVGDALADPENRSLFIDLVKVLDTDPDTTIIAADAELFSRGVAFYAQRRDKKWGLTDCISFVAMADLGLAEALTADRHFEQAGFVALLK